MIFKRKYKRSEWFEGLLLGEEVMKEYGEETYYITYYNEVVGYDEYYGEFAKGYFAYLNHYKNNFK